MYMAARDTVKLGAMSLIALATNVRLNYHLTSNEGAETIVFVNGLTMNLASWAAVSETFEDNYRCLRYDCRGQGESDKPAGPYTPEQHVADLLALLEALDLQQVHLVGLSNGGLISMMVAGGVPERILSLTVIDSFVRADSMLKTILRSWKAALTAGGTALRFDVATPWVWGHRYLAAHQQDFAALRELASQADPQAVLNLIEGLLGFEDARDRLHAYTGKVLILVGENDVLTPPRYSFEIHRWAQQARLVILEQLGHAAPIEDPARVSRLIHDFLGNELGRE